MKEESETADVLMLTKQASSLPSLNLNSGALQSIVEPTLAMHVASLCRCATFNMIQSELLNIGPNPAHCSQLIGFAL